jgi:hypothetical protein
MIPLGTQPYDAQSPEDERPTRSSYLSVRDLRQLGIILFFFFLLMIPIYDHMKRQSEQSRCNHNIKEIGSALNQYAGLQDDRFPPIYVTGQGHEPDLDAQGRASTFATLLAPYMSRATFQCPSAKTEEAVRTEDPASIELTMLTTYGMFAPYSAYPRYLITNPNQVVLLAETSNHGARKTYNPVPLTAPDGAVSPSDGFLIGFSEDNFDPTGANAVTRLAFYDTAGGDFTGAGGSRHAEGIFFLYADGHREMLPRQAATVRMLGDEPMGLWAVPPPIRR